MREMTSIGGSDSDGFSDRTTWRSEISLWESQRGRIAYRCSNEDPMERTVSLTKSFDL